MRKLNKQLSEEQKARGVIFCSTLSKYNIEQSTDTKHEVFKSDSDKDDQIRRLLDDSFFNASPFKYNIVRGL